MNLIVLGGGTAGWLAALFIANNHPQHNVTVVASKSIGVIGAGEAVTGALTDILHGYYGDFGIDPLEFFKETKAMPKYGIMHRDWTSVKGHDYFGPIDGTLTTTQIPDSVFTYLMAQDPKKLHLGTFFGNLYEYDVSPVSKITHEFEESTHAFHFDAQAAAAYLEKVALRRTNCKLIDKKVLDANLDEQGNIKSLLFEDQTTIEGDFFIDASGFGRMLMNKLENKWISYKKWLPINAGLPFFVDYKENEDPKCYSVAWAQKAGWYWEACVQHRKGCGYTFSEDFISFDQAQAEIETTLGRAITPIKQFRFDTGRLENTWIKNCLAIGLSGSFAEPLEATSIHSTIQQLKHFTFEFLKDTKEDTLNPHSINLYNKRVNQMFDDYKEFLVSHYLGGRTDSEFWRYISAGNTLTDFNKDLRETCKSRIPTIHDFPGYPGAAGWTIWCYILAGTGQLTPEIARKHLTPSMEKQAIAKLNELSVVAHKMELTHYKYKDYRNTVKLQNLKYFPGRGEKWHGL